MKLINKYGMWLVIAGVLAFVLYKYNLNKPGIEAGELMPDISFATLDGDYYDSESLRGKYVLIDFWGSWCPPCKAANAELKSLYKEVQNNEKFSENFTLISIAYESDSTAWLKAIEDQRLNWPIQVMEHQRGDTPLTRAFKVVAFPTNFLIDPQGRIVGVNVSQTAVISRLRKI